MWNFPFLVEIILHSFTIKHVEIQQYCIDWSSSFPLLEAREESGLQLDPAGEGPPDQREAQAAIQQEKRWNKQRRSRPRGWWTFV